MEEICVRVLEGETIEDIAKSWEVPCGAVMLWILADADRRDQWKRTHEALMMVYGQQAVAIADASENDGLRVRTRLALRDQWQKERGPGEGEPVTVVVSDG